MDTLQRLRNNDAALTRVAFRSEASNTGRLHSSWDIVIPHQQVSKRHSSWNIPDAASVIVPSTNERQLARLSRQLAYAVRKNQHIETVFVLVEQEEIVESSGGYGVKELMRGILQKLASFSSLKTLVIKTDIHLEVLTEMLKKAQNLETFELIDYCEIQGEDDLSDSALINFCDSLKDHGSLRRVKFEPSVKVDEQIQFYSVVHFQLDPIIQAFSKMLKLEILHIRPKLDDHFYNEDGTGYPLVSDSALAELCAAPKLRELEIDFRYSYEGFNADFSLPNFRFSPNGGDLLLTETIKNSSSLRRVSFHAEGKGFASNLAQALSENTRLECVRLTQTGIEPEIMQMLAHSLTLNSSLVELDLSHCSLCDSNVTVLTPALEVNSTLKILKLSNNKLKENVFEPFAEALKNNETLETLDLHGNHCSRATFRDALRNNTTLLYLDNDFYCGGDDDWSVSSDDSRVPDQSYDFDTDVDFFLFLNRAGRKPMNALLKSSSASQIDFVQCLVKVGDVHREICEARDRSCVGFLKDYYEVEDWEDVEKFEDAELLSGIYYFLRQEPTKFLFKMENGLSEGEGTVPYPPAKKLKLARAP